MRILLRLLVATPLLAHIAGTLSVYPHQLAYFNELAGGPENGHQHLLHSNLDWGQDLLILAEKSGDTVAVADVYYGGFNPAAIGIVQATPLDEVLPAGTVIRISKSIELGYRFYPLHYRIPWCCNCDASEFRKLLTNAVRYKSPAYSTELYRLQREYHIGCSTDTK